MALTGSIEAYAYAQVNSGNLLALGTFAGHIWAQDGDATPAPPTANVNVSMVHGDADETLPSAAG